MKYMKGRPNFVMWLILRNICI